MAFQLRSDMAPALKLTLSVWAGCLLMQILRLLVAIGQFPAWSPAFFLLTSLSGIGLSAMLLAVLTLTQGRFGHWRRLVIGLATVAVAVAQSVIDHLVYRGLLMTYGRRFPAAADLDGIAQNLSTYLWVYSLYVMALELLRMARVAGEEARHAAEARELAHEARLQALRLQLNPHFLFNTLNAISGLMLAGRVGEAEAMLGKLCDFLRASLAVEEGALTPLIAELGFVEAYLDIEAVRFGPALEVRIDCPEHLYFAKVPVFILQPLVENAVKYGVAPSEEGGRISILARGDRERLTIEIVDRGIKAVDAGGIAGGMGVGLSNTRARLAALYGENASLRTKADETGFIARLDLPLAIDPVAMTA